MTYLKQCLIYVTVPVVPDGDKIIRPKKMVHNTQDVGVK